MLGTPVDTKALAKLIQPSKLAEQGFPVPERVFVNFRTDHSGDDAFYICVVFPDDIKDEALSWQNTEPMVRWIRNRIRTADGEQHWSYVRLTRRSDLLSEESNVASQH
jgi:hypothetical protein